VFVVSYIGGAEQVPSGAVLKVLGPLFALAVAVELCIAMLGSALKGIKTKGAPIHAGFGQPAHIGTQLLTKYLFAFEAASILLLVAAIGAVVLARRRRGLEGGDEEPGADPPPRARLRRHDGRRAPALRSTRYDELLRPDDESGTQQEPKPEATHTGGW